MFLVPGVFYILTYAESRDIFFNNEVIHIYKGNIEKDPCGEHYTNRHYYRNNPENKVSPLKNLALIIGSDIGINIDYKNYEYHIVISTSSSYIIRKLIKYLNDNL